MDKKISNLFKGDKGIWMIFFFLCMISIVEVFSASSNLTYKSQNYISPILFHTIMIIFGAFMAIVTLNIPCKYFKLMTVPFLILSGFTLLWVFVGGQTINGANRVISIFGITFQPSELAKGSVVLYTAQILGATQGENGADKKAFKWINIVLWPAVIAIGLENLSTALLLLAVIIIMMWIGRVPYRQLGKLIGGLVAVAIFALVMILAIGKNEPENKALSKTDKLEKPKEEKSTLEKLLHRADTWKGRIIKFTDHKDISPQDYDLDKDAQVAHANIAIVSSNIIGKGPGNSEERDFLSQAFSDFIYAIIIEETGIEGATVVCFLYIMLLFRTARIAARCKNNFPAFLAMGLSLLLVIQATFNMMVAVGWVPVTGQPLPLISKGGTSTIINCVYMGVILSVSRWAKIKPEEKGKVEEKDA
jgi:cell division protein FtsW